jgi:hypothetical protein
MAHEREVFRISILSLQLVVELDTGLRNGLHDDTSLEKTAVRRP